MLNLTRYPHESIMIADDTKITVGCIIGDEVTLLVETKREVKLDDVDVLSASDFVAAKQKPLPKVIVKSKGKKEDVYYAKPANKFYAG